MSETGAPPRTLVVLAAVLASALAVTVAVLGLAFAPDNSGRDTPGDAQRKASGPLPLVSVPAPEADSPHCTTLIEAAPRELESSGEKLTRRELAEPAPPATVAWGGDPVVLRCGLDRPPELTPSSVLRSIDEVRWLPVPGEGTTTWYTVDREVYVALTVPETTGTGPLQQLSETIADVLPAAPLDFG
ncbi:DUF3515 domain-containing protein [Saccharomonospora xinjiangensis]|uniref:DUF3515 domain-containing protein n=1 Tax=Saccharomonospora xinjiangensis TaxID=75294 RepID=UPI001430CF90|nr:DUF3515 domain-containing protein [Saccharomonospora xinjiangensis]